MPEFLRVMTFNIRGARRKDGENAWKHRAPLNVGVIRHYAPDLIGFQELQDANLRTYRAELPKYEYDLGPGYGHREPYLRNAIFWNPSRLTPMENGGFWLSETPEKHSRSWGSEHARAANWVRFHTLPERTEFLHLNTHLDHGSGTARVEGSRLIVWRLASLADGDPAILTGDFNCNPGSRTYRNFAQAGFTDAHRAAGNPRSNTFHKFQGESFRPDKEARIDWILLRGGERGGEWTVSSCQIVRDCEPPVYPSDHYPVVADLTLMQPPRLTLI